MHRGRDEQDTPDLVERRAAVEADLRSVLEAFARMRIAIADDSIGSEIDAIARLPGAGLVNVALRTLIQRDPVRLAQIAEADGQLVGGARTLTALSSDYWDLVDAFGCVCDSVRGRWPYMSVDNRMRRLDDALATVELLRERLVAGGYLPACLQPGIADDETEAVAPPSMNN